MGAARLCRLVFMLRPRLRRRFDCGPVLHAHDKTRGSPEVIAADLPQQDCGTVLTGFGLKQVHQIKRPYLIGDTAFYKLKKVSLLPTSHLKKTRPNSDMITLRIMPTTYEV